jgi:hypothetical protein
MGFMGKQPGIRIVGTGVVAVADREVPDRGEPRKG